MIETLKWAIRMAWMRWNAETEPEYRASALIALATYEHRLAELEA